MKKVYVVIGASSDIGLELIQSIAAKEPESKIYCHYRRQFALDLPNTIPIQADLASRDGVESLIKKIGETPTHIVHLPAGKFEYIRFKDAQRETIYENLEIGIFSMLDILKAFLPKMAKSHYGRIAVMLTGCTRDMPPKYLTSYVIAKYALLGLMKSAAAEYEGKGIFINALSPEMTQTKFLDGIDERLVETAVGNSRFGRILSVSEVVAGIEYLLQDTTIMNGENLFLG